MGKLSDTKIIHIQKSRTLKMSIFQAVWLKMCEFTTFAVVWLELSLVSLVRVKFG